MRFRRILAATALPGSPDPAIENARTLARLTGAELHVFHARYATSGTGDEASAPEVQQRLEALASDAASANTAAGRPYRVISRRAADVRADLIVLGERSRRTGLPTLLGNTADRIVRTARLPCLLSHGSVPPRPTRLLVAMDQSRNARRAMRVAANLALGIRRHESPDDEPITIHLLTISAYATAAGRHVRQAVAQLAPLAEHMSSRMEPYGVRVTHAVRSAALPGEGILEYCSEFDPDIAFMGTHGEGPVIRALIGSVAVEVARSLPKPILLVPPRGRRVRSR
jgi:universal stress protein E